MRKHFLLPIRVLQDLPNSVYFVSTFFKSKQNIALTLFYLCEKKEDDHLSSMWYEGEGAPQLPNTVKKYLDRTREFLIKSGFPETNLSLKVCSKKQAVAKEIIREANAVLYDAVIIGKRTTNMFEKIFTDNISQDIVDGGLNFPLWFCFSREINPTNILLCLDGSETAARKIADHVGFILEEEAHTVTLFHVDNGKQSKIDSCFNEARNLLMENGISPEKIKERTIESGRVVKHIVQTAENGNFAAIATGWSGSGSKGFMKLFTSEISRALMDTIENSSLWVVP